MQKIVDNITSDKKVDVKPVKCPKWGKDESFRSFKRRLECWEKIEKGKGRYLQLLEALQQEGRKKEKERIELEEQNNLINPDDENVIKEIILKMDKWFGKPIDKSRRKSGEFDIVLISAISFWFSTFNLSI